MGERDTYPYDEPDPAKWPTTDREAAHIRDCFPLSDGLRQPVPSPPWGDKVYRGGSWLTATDAKGRA